MKLLLAIDSSDTSEAAVREVAWRPWPAGTTVCVLTVIDIFALTYSVGYLETFTEKETEAARALVERVAGRLAKKGLETTTRVIEGYPSTAIVDYANEWGADFVFVGSHGHSGVVRFFVGSVAKTVVHDAKCSVAIVRAAAPAQPQTVGAGMRVLLATDGSDYSAAAARSIATRPWPEGTQVKIVSVADFFVPAVDPWYTTGEVNDQIRQASISQAKDAAGEGERVLSGAGLVLSSEILLGSPKTRILDEATEWKADLVVVGSHGRRGITRVLLGSVSEAVAMRAHCSVEVIRAHGNRQQ